MKSNWIYAKKAPEDVIAALMKSFNLEKKILEIIINRGYDSEGKIKNFLNPMIDSLHSPFEMHDMDKAVKRIEQALKNDEKILIYGDYDVDGTTSVATMYLFLKKLNGDVTYYIPDRYTEGYGISRRGIDSAIADDIGLIIALDCGTKDFESIKYAKKNNIDVIVCDHHQTDSELPEAYAILNPKKSKCRYPFKELSGCGIGFKLISALAEKKNLSKKEYFYLLDFIAISIACDIVPIVGENRILMTLGLKKISEKPISSIKMLIDASGRSSNPTVSDIVFGVGPRINAAGRIDHAHAAVEALISDNDNLDKHIENLEILNKSRKEIDKQMTEQALEMITEDINFEKKSTTILYNPLWHKGVIGIVASRCIEHYYRPTIIFTLSQGKITGSGRSVNGINLYEILSKCAEYLDRFGGHDFAAGMTLDILNLEKFKKKFDDEVTKIIGKEGFSCPQNIDAEIDLLDINFKLYNDIKKMGPFGPENMLPIFSTKITQKVEYDIINDAHLKFSIKQKKGVIINAIGFNLKEKADILESENFEIAFSIEEDDFNGNKDLVLRVRDIREA